MGTTLSDAETTDSDTASARRGVVLPAIAGIASTVAVVTVALMLLRDGLAASSWPMILAVASLGAAALALLGWWRQRPSTRIPADDGGTTDS